MKRLKEMNDQYYCECGCEYGANESPEVDLHHGGFCEAAARCPDCGKWNYYKDGRQELKWRFEELLKKNFIADELVELNDIFDGEYFCKDVIFEEVDE